jgi:RNA polymerase sigma-70 factor (ECF subfamily)
MQVAELEQQFRTAAAHWPRIRLDWKTFEAYWRERAAASDDLEPAPDTAANAHVASLYLCCACAQGDEAACEIFRQSHLTLVRQAVARIESSPHFVDEVVAVLFDRLLVGPDPRLTRYRGRGSLGAWLKVSATRAALDAKRSRHDVEWEPLSLIPEPALSMSPESLVFCREHAQHILDALKGAIEGFDSKQRHLLRLHYLEGLNIDEIGELYEVHRATAARWLQQARADIDSSVRRELRARHGLDENEIARLAYGAGPYLEDLLGKLLGVG